MLAAMMAAVGMASIISLPAQAMKHRFSKAVMCQALGHTCEAPARYRSGPFLEPPRIVSVSMQRIQAICVGEVSAASGSIFPYSVMGCAQLTGSGCMVHVSNSLKEVAGLYELVLAHELAHCRGWRH